MISLHQFQQLGQQGYNRVPLIKRTWADLDTPLSLYLKLTKEAKRSFLLESVEGGERFGRYSFIGLPARTWLRSTGFAEQALTEVIQDETVIEQAKGNPLDFIEQYQARFKVALNEQLPRFCGGLVGYFGYDTIRHIEKKLQGTCPPDPLGLPDILLLQTDELAVVDNLAGQLILIVYVNPQAPDDYARGLARLDELTQQLKTPLDYPPLQNTPTSASLVHERSKENFEQAVQEAKRLIQEGDCMQLVIGQRMHQPFSSSPLSFYRALRMINPSPYLYFYHFGDFHVAGASPEILVRYERTPQGAKATIRPLAGTRPRSAEPQEDLRIEKELLADPKERAEHVMLIDLARNDIGRIAKPGTVKVTEAFVVERYSHVMHIVSNVEGVLQDNITPMDVLRASFPAGTLTGAPKIHAMEIIDRLEPTKRGIYGGACGYISYAGDMDVAIAIRTGVIKDQMLYVQAGAGIVADSVAESEWNETCHKARALIRAAEFLDKTSSS